MTDTTLFHDASLAVVGAVCRDVKTAPLPAEERLFRDGETSVDGIGETIGGGAANSAAIAVGLGARVHLAGLVGDDPLAGRIERALGGAGVRCHLRRQAGLVTGTTVNLVFASGQRHFLSCHPNNAALAFEHLDLAVLTNARHLLRADVWFSPAMLFGGNERLLREARRRGLATSLDLNWDPQWGRAPADEIVRRKAAVRAILPLVDLAHGNARELGEFTDAPDLAAALDRLTAWGVGAVVVHLGAAGAGYYADGRLITAPAVPVRQRVAATGTGDVLSACLILLHHRDDLPMREKLGLANRIVAEFMEGRRPFLPALA